MDLNDYKISHIDSIKVYGHKCIEKNIPDYQEVSLKEFNTFVK